MNGRGTRLKRRALAPMVVILASLVGATVAPADTVSRLGDIGSILLPASGLVVAAAHHDGKGVFELTKAYGAAMAVVYILKPTIDRARPDGGSMSFPSGHSASAFAGAAFQQRRYGWGYGAPAYAAATFVAWSRVESKHHFTSDVIAGAAIGIAGNLVFTRRFSRVSVLPTAVPGGAGLSLKVWW